MVVLEVWGDPIAHSRSPLLHAAAYRVLGLQTWTYGRRRVDAASFSTELARAAGAVRGLSLTMPLKQLAFEAAATVDDRAALLGVANTLLLTGDQPAAWNTDVGGFVGAVREHLPAGLETARVVGAGATASAAVAALAELGVRDLQIVARSAERAQGAHLLAERLGMRAHIAELGGVAPFQRVDVTVATLPGGTRLPAQLSGALADASGPLLDAVYDPWPSALGTAWQARGGEAWSGLGMLVHQAVLQVRIFLTGDVTEPLDNEAEVLAAMRVAAMGD